LTFGRKGRGEMNPSLSLFGLSGFEGERQGEETEEKAQNIGGPSSHQEERKKGLTITRSPDSKIRGEKGRGGFIVCGGPSACRAWEGEEEGSVSRT